MMLARGLKRKCSEDVPTDALQRQSLLDMSLAKLQLCRMLAEPSLCRSVLIANTVRQIQEDMAQDGTWCTTPSVAAPAPLERLVSTDILCRPVRGQDGVLPGLGDLTQDLPPRSLDDSLWGTGGPPDRGSLPSALGHIFETLEGKRPSAVDELFSEVGGAYYDLDMLTGVGGAVEGLEGFPAAATTASGSSCKLDLGERGHLVGVLVEA